MAARIPFPDKLMNQPPTSLPFLSSIRETRNDSEVFTGQFEPGTCKTSCPAEKFETPSTF
jgi:hypothetical protein